MDPDDSSNPNDLGITMDPDDSSNPNDLGVNMDSASASSETPRANLDPITSYDDHSGIHSGQSSSSQASTMHPNIHLRCVNCSINISRMRRHPLVIAEVRHLIQRWVEPQQVQVTSDNLVCHSCWMSAWSEIRQPAPTGQQSEPIVGHAHVCISCGHSLLRTRSHTLRSDTTREDRIMNEVARQVAPRELPRSASVCHTCWRRIDRAVSRNVQDTPARPSSVLSESIATASTTNEEVVANANCILLPNYIRAPGTQSRCFFPNCASSERLAVPNDLRVRLFCDYNFYVPAECRICLYHLRSNTWDSLLESLENPIRTFSANQIEEFASLLKNSMFSHLDFENISEMPDHIVHYYLGFSKVQFLDILSNVPRLSNKHRGSFALAAYLIKLRTGDSDERLAALLQVPRSTLERHMNEARELLTQDFVPRNLGINHITRAEIAARNLIIPGGLYEGEDRSPIIIADGTYIYIEKSSNYLYQKKTYSLHKYRNLVKPFLLVCTDGYILDVLGPYPATTSDATIMINEFQNENSSYRQYFQPGDVFILDRGFRDSLPLLTTCGYRVHVPLSPEDGESQLTTMDANKSRAVTLCRWVVEVVNGIFKSSYKIFRQNFFNRASSHLMKDLAVAAGLINKYHTKIRDREDATQILEIVCQNMNVNNDLSDYVREHNLNRVRAHFTNINVNIENVREFPILTYDDLILIACGTYQIKQARSYYGEHIRFNGSYRIEVCTDRRRSILEASAFGSNCYLLRTKISSRHITRKIYFVYILINTNNTGRAAIQKYCCNCIVGRRTVGCCAHVMSVIWYLGWARHQSNIEAPALFLDEVLIVYDTNDE